MTTLSRSRLVVMLFAVFHESLRKLMTCFLTLPLIDALVLT